MLPFDDTTFLKIKPGNPRSSGMLRNPRTQANQTTTYSKYIDIISTVLMMDSETHYTGPLDEVDLIIICSELNQRETALYTVETIHDSCDE